MELRFIGFDDKKRKVYIDNSGKFWKPLTIEHKEAHALFRSENNEFNGEPFGNALPTGDERLVQIVDRFSSYDNKERNKEICEKIEKLVSDMVKGYKAYCSNRKTIEFECTITVGKTINTQYSIKNINFDVSGKHMTFEAIAVVALQTHYDGPITVIYQGMNHNLNTRRYFFYDGKLFKDVDYRGDKNV